MNACDTSPLIIILIYAAILIDILGLGCKAALGCTSAL